MTTVVGGFEPDTVQKLIHHVEKIEKFEEEKKDIAELIKDEFVCAKSEGFDTKVMKIVLKMRARDADDISEEETLVELYKTALGMH